MQNMEGDTTMNIFTVASITIFSVLAVYSLVVSVLSFCGNKRIITEKMQQRYHVRTYRLHNGFFHLGYSLFAAAVAYLSYIDPSWHIIIIFIFMAYSIAGPIHLLKSKHLIKDPGVDIINDMTETQAQRLGSLMLGFYMGLPVLILIGALLLY